MGTRWSAKIENDISVQTMEFLTGYACSMTVHVGGSGTVPAYEADPANVEEKGA